MKTGLFGKLNRFASGLRFYGFGFFGFTPKFWEAYGFLTK